MKTVFLAAMLLLVLLFPSNSAKSATRALQVWGQDIVPSLFPYMVLCQAMTIELKRYPSITLLAALVLGILGGSPSGSAMLAQSARFSSLSHKQRLCLFALAGTISPMFFLGPVTSWLHSSSAGRILLISQLSGACITSILIFLISPNREIEPLIPDLFNGSDSSPIHRSVDAILNVGGCIVFFSVASSCLELILPKFNKLQLAVLHALLEISGGVRAIAQCTVPDELKLFLCAGASGFGGLSVLFQNLVFLRPFGIKIHQLILLGTLRAIFSALSVFILNR